MNELIETVLQSQNLLTSPLKSVEVQDQLLQNDTVYVLLHCELEDGQVIPMLRIAAKDSLIHSLDEDAIKDLFPE